MKFLPILILVAFSSVIVIGCSSQHNAQTGGDTSSYASTLLKAKKNKQNCIMQSGVNVYRIVSIEIEKSRQEMTVQLNKLDSANTTNSRNQESLTPGGDGNNSTKNRLIVYMKDSTSYTLDEPHTMPLNKIARIEKRNQ